MAPEHAPDAVDHTSGYFEARPRLFLYYQHWAAPSARVPLVIVHGMGEHSGRYAETAQQLTQAGFAVYAFDLEGHGRSPGVRGHVRAMDDYVADLAGFVHLVSARHPDAKPLLLGHSLGGLIATFYAEAHPGTMRCLVLSSPLWGLTVRVPGWQRWLAYRLSSVWPALTMPRPHGREVLISHDPDVARRYLTDPLMHFVASVRFYVVLQRCLGELPTVVAHLREPLLVLQAGNDRVTSAEATARIFERVGSHDKRLIVYEGYYHEVLNEAGRARVVSDLLGWLREHLPAG